MENPKYIICLNNIERGDGDYYGREPWRGVTKDKVIVFKTMKEARRSLNRLNGRLLRSVKGTGASIESF